MTAAAELMAESAGLANVQMDLHKDGDRCAPPVKEPKTAEAELMAESAAASEPSEGGRGSGGVSSRC